MAKTGDFSTVKIGFSTGDAGYQGVPQWDSPRCPKNPWSFVDKIFGFLVIWFVVVLLCYRFSATIIRLGILDKILNLYEEDLRGFGNGPRGY